MGAFSTSAPAASPSDLSQVNPSNPFNSGAYSAAPDAGPVAPVSTGLDLSGIQPNPTLDSTATDALSKQGQVALTTAPADATAPVSPGDPLTAALMKGGADAMGLLANGYNAYMTITAQRAAARDRAKLIAQAAAQQKQQRQDQIGSEQYNRNEANKAQVYQLYQQQMQKINETMMSDDALKSKYLQMGLLR